MTHSTPKAEAWKPDKRLLVAAMFVWLCLAGLIQAPPAAAQLPTPAPTAGQTPSQVLDLQKSLQKTLAAERQTTAQLSEQLKYVLRFEQEIESGFNAHKIQISVYNSVLAMPAAPLAELETVRRNIQTTLDQIGLRLNDMGAELETLDQAQEQTEQQLRLNQEQLDEIKADEAGLYQNDPRTEELLATLETLTNVLATKQQMVEQVQAIYARQLEQLENIRADFKNFLQKADAKIEEQKRRELLERKKNPLTMGEDRQIRDEFRQLWRQAQPLFSLAAWQNTLAAIWRFEGFLLLRFIVLFAIMLWLLRRGQQYCTRLQSRSQSGFFWRQVIVALLCRSLLLAGVLVLCYGYAQATFLYAKFTAIRVVVYLLMIWLFCRWLQDFLTLYANRAPEAIPDPLLRLLRLLIALARWFSIGYVILEAILGTASVLLLCGRLILEIGLLAWSIPAIRAFRHTAVPHCVAQPKLRRKIQSLLIGTWYTLVAAGLLLELTGYGQLSRYWYLSWGRALIVVLWTVLGVLGLREFDQELNAHIQPEDRQGLQAGHQLRWLLLRVLWVFLPVLCLAGILLSWGAKHIVIASLFQILTYPVPISGLHLSLLSLLYAFLILVVTHVAVRVWRYMLKTRILANSGLEMGLQISIITISVYLLWMVGILWALYTLGVDATTLAVMFGALGIGLGFGLQSIFNNFISGLILLFERPIEVGDVVEVGGAWGSVEKITVRSTVVRTFDNAALIIPNADIITNQLTNWTFKDLKIRRAIKVGVAYGSDVKLVEQVLYEAAEQHARVLRDPAPLVLFSDFGDSALIFTLRVWTLLDYCLTAEHDLRVAIDQTFREHHITIPFPQHDVHFYPESESK